jgi:hypothetical protein
MVMSLRGSDLCFRAAKLNIRGKKIKYNIRNGLAKIATIIGLILTSESEQNQLEEAFLFKEENNIAVKIKDSIGLNKKSIETFENNVPGMFFMQEN